MNAFSAKVSENNCQCFLQVIDGQKSLIPTHCLRFGTLLNSFISQLKLKYQNYLNSYLHVHRYTHFLLCTQDSIISLSNFVLLAFLTLTMGFLFLFLFFFFGLYVNCITLLFPLKKKKKEKKEKIILSNYQIFHINQGEFHCENSSLVKLCFSCKIYIIKLC